MFRQLDPRPIAAALVGGLAASVLDEDTAHGLGRSGEEMTAVVEPLVSDEPQVGFVNERGGVERVTGLLGRHAYRGELAEFVVDER